MKISFILPVLVVFLLIVTPVAGTLNKITQNAPVYIGEKDVDISTALNGCHIIDWWPEGKNINTDPPGKNISIVPQNSVSDQIYHYTFSPDVFTGYTGAWYCEDNSLRTPVFTLYSPNISLKVWDLDHDADVSGQSIPFGTNITYRIDTNLAGALNYNNRPNANPTDSFYTVSMANPFGSPVTLLYTGSAGNPSSVILPFDARPFITTSPYYGKNMKDWSHSARDLHGSSVYTAGTYTIAVRSNLNHMAESYGSKPTDTAGKITDTATVTLVQQAAVTTIAPPVEPGTEEPTIRATTTAVPSTPPTTSPVAKKTTYSPLPVWVSLAAAGAAGLGIMMRKH